MIKEPRTEDYFRPGGGGLMAYNNAMAEFMNQPPPGVNYATQGGGSVSPYQVPKIYPDQPDMPTYQSGWDPSMAISPTIAADLPGLALDRTGLNAFSSEALRKGPSEWANRAKEEQNYLAMDARNRGAATASGQAASARAQLAARGGLSSGAAERLAQGSADNYLSMTQDVNNTLSKNRMQIGMNDEQNRMSALAQLPGMQLNAANYDKGLEGLKLSGMTYDLNNQMQQNQNLNNWNLQMADIAGQQWGAMKTAEGQRNQGKK